MPPNTISVARPGKWGNPFNFAAPDNCWNALALGCRGDAKGRREAAVKAFEQWVDDPRGRVKEMDFGLVMEGAGGKVQLGRAPMPALRLATKKSEKHCAGNISPASAHLISHCHADVLLRIANEVPSKDS